MTFPTTLNHLKPERALFLQPIALPLIFNPLLSFPFTSPPTFANTSTSFIALNQLIANHGRTSLYI